MPENDLRKAYFLRKYLNLKSITLNFLNILQYGFGLIRYSILCICFSRAFLHCITMTIHFGGLSIKRSPFFVDARHSFTQMAPPYIVWLKTHKAWHSFSLFVVLRTFVSCFDVLACCLAKMDDSEMGPVVLSLCSLVTPCHLCTV